MLIALEPGDRFDADITVIHPPFPGFDVTDEFWISPLREDLRLNGFTFEHAYELQPGTWYFSATFDGELIYAIEFEVVDPARAPELAGICAGFVMS